MNFRKRLLIKARRTARELYWSEFDQEQAVCAACGRDRPLDVHHRDGDPLNNHLVNLIAVCKPCHRQEHKIRSRHASLESWKSRVDDLGRDSGVIATTAAAEQPALTDGGETR